MPGLQLREALLRGVMDGLQLSTAGDMVLPSARLTDLTG